MYGETNLGATDEAMLTFFKTPMNKPIFDALKNHVYPEFALHLQNETETPVEEPDVNPVVKSTKSSKK